MKMSAMHGYSDVATHFEKYKHVCDIRFISLEFTIRISNLVGWLTHYRCRYFWTLKNRASTPMYKYVCWSRYQCRCFFFINPKNVWWMESGEKWSSNLWKCANTNTSYMINRCFFLSAIPYAVDGIKDKQMKSIFSL